MLLSFRELEPLSCALLSVLLTFFLTRVTRDQAGLLQGRAKVGVEFHQRTRDPVTNGSRLARRTTAINIHENVELADRVGQAKRLTDDHPKSFVREVRIERTAINNDVAAARTQVNTCCRGFSATRAVIL